VNEQLADKGFVLLDGVRATADQLASYDDCPHDEFMGNGTRYKRFSQYKLTHRDTRWSLELLPRRAYVAPKKFNPVGGGMKRPYEPIQVDFGTTIAHLAEQLRLDATVPWQINVHQNRSIATADKNGQLTPEGRHKDGHEFVSISVFARSDVDGGETRVWQSADSATPLLKRTMQAEETVLLDDRSVLHDVSDIEPASSRQGTRDILIVAYSRWDERWYGDEHDTVTLEPPEPDEGRRARR